MMADTSSSPARNLPVDFSRDVRAFYADRLALGLKADGMCVLSWQFVMPDNLPQEQVRVVVTRRMLESAVDLICGQTGYTPKTAAKGKAKPKSNNAASQ